MSKKVCLMIECKDKNIFTSKKNYKSLIEFANNFDLKLHHAKTDPLNICELEKIPELFCSAGYKGPSDYLIIKKNIIKKKTSRQTILEQAQAIRDKMKKFVTSHDFVTFNQIKNNFDKYNISTTALNNLFRQVRKELDEKGVKVTKIKNGYYKVN